MTTWWWWLLWMCTMFPRKSTSENIHALTICGSWRPYDYFFFFSSASRSMLDQQNQEFYDFSPLALRRTHVLLFDFFSSFFWLFSVVFLSLTNLPITNLHTIMASIKGLTIPMFTSDQCSPVFVRQSPYVVRSKSNGFGCWEREWSTHLKELSKHLDTSFRLIRIFRFYLHIESESINLKMVNWFGDWNLKNLRF